jgi:hypothetical protein
MSKKKRRNKDRKLQRNIINPTAINLRRILLDRVEVRTTSTVVPAGNLCPHRC